jgi:type III restriction enzyme
METLRQGRVIVRNWHALNWETEEKIKKKRSVDKRGAKSNEAYVRDVLGVMANARNILIVNLTVAALCVNRSGTSYD